MSGQGAGGGAEQRADPDRKRWAACRGVLAIAWSPTSTQQAMFNCNCAAAAIAGACKEQVAVNRGAAQATALL
jgi:hypothetical protein